MDIALVWDNVNGRADFAMNATGTDLLTDATPMTAVIISLFSDRLADSGDVIRDGTGDPRGWWGDTALPNASDAAGGLRLTGSKFWLHYPGLRVTETLRLIESDAKTALQWMIQDGVAQTVAASAVFPAAPPQAIELTVSIVLAGGTPWTNSFGFPLAQISI